VLPVKEPFRSILVLYQIKAASVYILRVLHGARQLEDLLTDESAE
jgi:plasmid stabilization system protein ParE